MTTFLPGLADAPAPFSAPSPNSRRALHRHPADPAPATSRLPPGFHPVPPWIAVLTAPMSDSVSWDGHRLYEPDLGVFAEFLHLPDGPVGYIRHTHGRVTVVNVPLGDRGPRPRPAEDRPLPAPIPWQLALDLEQGL